MSSITLAYLADHKEYIPELAQGVFTQWETMYTGQGKGPKDLEAQMLDRAITDAIPLTMIALENDKLVGSVTIKTQDFASRPDLSPWIAAVFVFPEFRHRGIGSKLVLHAEKIAKENFGVDKIYLYTGSASKLYAKLGYAVVEEVDRGDKILTVMEKGL